MEEMEQNHTSLSFERKKGQKSIRQFPATVIYARNQRINPITNETRKTHTTAAKKKITETRKRRAICVGRATRSHIYINLEIRPDILKNKS